MAKKKAMTLRQRLRADADKRLDALERAMISAAVRVCEENDTELNPALLMQLASQPKHGKTLRHQLITDLANEAEAKLEAIYNNQLPLSGVDNDDS